MKKNHQWNLSYFLTAFVVFTVVQFLWTEHRVVQNIPYSQFLQLLNEQKVSDLQVEKDQISGKLQVP
ncbi:ATP-dependent metallopeptidase FtsH/Yme1/Tma family protein, partial [Salmonella enterica subsp. enterica serovar Typhimurium]